MHVQVQAFSVKFNLAQHRERHVEGRVHSFKLDSTTIEKLPMINERLTGLDVGITNRLRMILSHESVKVDQFPKFSRVPKASGMG